jgi:hypothetical protein
MSWCMHYESVFSTSLRLTFSRTRPLLLRSIWEERAIFSFTHHVWYYVIQLFVLCYFVFDGITGDGRAVKVDGWMEGNRGRARGSELSASSGNVSFSRLHVFLLPSYLL